MVIIKDVEQGTPEWHELKLGVLSSSRFKDLLTTTGAPSKVRKKYKNELIDEILTGERVESYKNKHMQRGNDREHESREAYEFAHDTAVEQVAFCFFDESKTFGCSPDGLVGEDGGFETKDALPHIQIERIEGAWKGAEHFQQVQGSLYVTGRKWWDLQSYSRGLPIVTVRIYPDVEFIKKLAIEIRLLTNELQQIKERYKK
jgi:hypothetical protein